MLINKGKASDTKLKLKVNNMTKEVPSKLRKNLNENLRKPLSKLLESNSNHRPLISPLNNNLMNSLKPATKSTPLTNSNIIKHDQPENKEDNLLKNHINTLRNSDTFNKRFFPNEKQPFPLKKSSQKKDVSSKNTSLANNNNNFNASINHKQQISSNTNSIVSPSKLVKQISSLTNNNLTTNFTDNAKEGLTIKTNTIEQSGEMANTLRSPENYRSITNCLKTISSNKITPKANSVGSSMKFQGNVLDGMIKIVQYNDESTKTAVDFNNLNILNSIQQFGAVLRSSSFGGNSIYNEENVRKINDLNNVLKSLSSEGRESVCNMQSQGKNDNNWGSNCFVSTNFTNSTEKSVNHKLMIDKFNKNMRKSENKSVFSPKNNKNTHNFNENEDCNITGFSIEHKLNSANTKDKIISEIYKNSDVRIRKYGVLFEFITNNIGEIKNIIMNNTKTHDKNNDDNDLLEMKYNHLENHLKKKSSTSNELENMAKKINDDNLVFSSLSLLDSTPKKPKEESSSRKLIESSRNFLKNNTHSENCNESDIEEYAEMDAKLGYYMPKQNVKITEEAPISHRKRKQTVNIDFDRSYVVSSVNSDFYQEILGLSFAAGFDDISREMGEMKEDNIGKISDKLEQSIIMARKISKSKKNNDVSLDRTREENNFLDKKKLTLHQNAVKIIEHNRISIPFIKPKISSSKGVPCVEIPKGRMTNSNENQITHSNINTVVNQAPTVSEGKKDESRCSIF